MKLRNLRPGEWELPVLNLVVGSAPFDVDDLAIARNLLEQEGNYAPADDEAQALADEIAMDRDTHDEVVTADVSDMSARDLIASLDTLNVDELREKRTQEEAGKARTTVLARIDELLAPAGASEKE